MEAVVSIADLPLGITPGRRRHHPDNPMVAATSIAADPCPEKQTLMSQPERAMGEEAGDDHVPPLSLAVVPVQRRLAAHLLLDHEELHAETPQVNVAAVVLQSTGTPKDPSISREENAGAVRYRPIREDAHHLQSAEETRALLPNQDVIAHVHHLEADLATMTEMAMLACPHHAVDVPLHTPKIDRESVLTSSRIVTPLIHADPIAAAVENVLETALKIPVGVRCLRAKYVRAERCHPKSTKLHPGETMKAMGRAALVQQRRWVSIPSVAGQLFRAYIPLASILLYTHRAQAKLDVLLVGILHISGLPLGVA